MKLLVVEDEEKAAQAICKGLGESGFDVEHAADGEDGLRLARERAYDAIVLDIMLPKRDGWSVLTELRREGRGTPILVLTARDEVPDRVKGLELGADDYLVGDPETEPELIRARSPLFHIERIRGPLLIAQGANDPRVAKAESLQIVEAMRAAGKEVEYLEFADEGHGLVRPANRLRFYGAAERFLARHLGGSCEAT
jgi:DNA-binding response OmpR family regulator